MHILMITDRYPPETRSAAHLFQDLAEGLAKEGHCVTVLTRMPVEYLPEGFREGPLLGHECIGNITVVRVGGLFSSKVPMFLRALDQAYMALCLLVRALVYRPRPHVVLVYSPPLPIAVMIALYTRLTGVSYVLNLHDLYPRTAIELGVLRNKLVIWLARKLELIAYRYAQQIIVPAAASRRILVEERRIPAEKVHLVRNWIDTSTVTLGPTENGFRQANGLSGQLVVSYAGLMGYAQDLTTVIECARLVAGQPDVVFLLVGEGAYADRWKRMAAGMRNVRFFPSVRRRVYFDVLRASDICLVPLSAALESPAVPGKLQSIMAVGRPVVAIVPPAGEAAQVVRESRCGFVVRPGESEEFTRVIMQLYEHPGLRDELGRNGRRFAEIHFDLKSALGAVEKILSAAVSG